MCACYNPWKQHRVICTQNLVVYQMNEIYASLFIIIGLSIVQITLVLSLGLDCFGEAESYQAERKKQNYPQSSYQNLWYPINLQW